MVHHNCHRGFKGTGCLHGCANCKYLLFTKNCATDSQISTKHKLCIVHQTVQVSYSILTGAL